MTLSHNHITSWLRNALLASPALWRADKPLIHPAEVRRSAEGLRFLLVDNSILEKAYTDTNGLICIRYGRSPYKKAPFH